MPPELNGIDHIHLYVSNREEAAQWYKDVLGFTVVESLNLWANDESGPLTIQDPAGKIHLALFRKVNLTPSTAIAFNAEGKEFLEWKTYLEEQNISVRCADHEIAWSLYFKDLCGNSHEITTYQYDYVSTRIQ